MVSIDLTDNDTIMEPHTVEGKASLYIEENTTNWCGEIHPFVTGLECLQPMNKV